MIHVTSKHLAPDEEHYAIFKFFSVNTSTYEPNDGLLDGVSYEAYLNRQEWETEIKYLMGKQIEHIAVRVSKPVKPIVEIKISD